MSHSRAGATALVLISLGAAGCGESSTTSSRAAFIAKADQICYRVNSVRESSANSIKTHLEMADALIHLGNVEGAGAAELAKLVPPSSLAADWKTVVENAKIVAGTTAKVGEDARSGHGDLKQLASVSRNAQETVTATAKRDGFKWCQRTSIRRES